MTTKRRSLLALCLALVLMVSGTVVTFAATMTEDDFKVIVDTDKDVYSSGENINLSVYIENNAEDVTINGTSLYYGIPEAIQQYIVNYDKLPDSIELGEGNNVIFLSVVEPPETGDSNTVMLYVGILMMGAGFIILTRTRYFKKCTALFMAVIMIVGLGPVSAITAKAATLELFVEGSKTITYAGEEYTIYVGAVIEYDGEYDEEDRTAAELSGTELAKLLLANERLDADALSKKSSLVQTSFYSLGRNLINLSDITLDGKDHANSIDYYNSYINLINAETAQAAEYIDYIKENVAATGVWIDYGAVGGSVLLDVTDDEDWLYVKCDEYIYVCRRYTDDNGADVYEMYQKASDTATVYMRCIPGQYYEYATEVPTDDPLQTDGFFENYVVVENSRGYWNMFTTDGENNIQNLVAKSDVAYEYSWRIDSDNTEEEGYFGYTGYTLFMNPDLTCDLIAINGDFLEIRLAGFNGISTLNVDDDTNLITSWTTTKGKTFIDGAVIGIDSDDNKLVYDYGTASSTAGADDEDPYYLATLSFKLQGEEGQSLDMNSAAIKSIIECLDENYDITCKYQNALNTVLDGIDNSTAIAKNFDDYYSWNGYYMNSLDNVKAAIAAGVEKQDFLMDGYEAVKDADVIEWSSTYVDYDTYTFADANINAGSVTVSDTTLTVDGLQLSVSESEAVLEVGESYGVYLAICSANNEIVLTGETPEPVKYNGSTLNVLVSGTYTIPTSAVAGEYVVSAYVATADGIRISEFVPLTTESAVEYETNADGYNMQMSKNDANEVVVSYIETHEYLVEIPAGASVTTYAEVYELLSAEVLKYGYPENDAVLQVYDTTEGWVDVEEDDTITSGSVYRLEYSLGYVYVKLQ